MGIARLFACALVLAGCSSEVDSDDEPPCTDPAYGNGTCDLETSCKAPDIDCFKIFNTQAEAQAWFATTPDATREPPVPASDPRFAHVKELVDQGWEAYKATRPVGELRDREVQLVFVKPAALSLAAFVAPADMATKGAFAVFVELPLLDMQLPDDQLMGIVMHELEHVMGLHQVADMRARIQHFYVAPGTTEPFGYAEPDDPAIRALFDEWTASAAEVNHYADTELHGMPLGGLIGSVFETAMGVEAMATNTSACNGSMTQYTNLLTTLKGKLNALDDSITVDATTSNTIVTVLGNISTNCFATETATAIDITASLLKLTTAQVRSTMPADLQAAVDGKPAVQGFYSWISYRRSRMRDVAARFMTLTGSPWDRLRYFSAEEAADNSSVISLQGMGLDPTGMGGALIKIGSLGPSCTQLLDGNLPIPYGERLDDDHHATCWRTGNIKRYSVLQAGSGRLAPLVLAPPRAPTLFEQIAGHDQLMN